MSHPVYGDLPYWRLNTLGQVCSHCGYDKASCGTRFSAEQPFCERCNQTWWPTRSDSKPDGAIAIVFEEVSEFPVSPAMNGHEG